MGMVASQSTSRFPFSRQVIMTILWIFILVMIILLLNLPWSPTFVGLGPDSGLFAYVGNSILHGQLPYRDVWEQKPPIGLYLNALAVFLFGRNPWAIWWLNLIWVTLSATVLFLILKKMMGLIPGAIASLLFILAVMNPDIYLGGNSMEIYSLLPQIAIIGCTYYLFVTKRNYWAFLAGLATGIAFMTKQTTIALGISSFCIIVLISLLLHEFKPLWFRLAGFIAGFLLPVGIAITYWFAAGALSDFWDAVFLHSISYVAIGAPFLWSIKNTFLRIFPAFFISKLYILAALSFLLYLFENLRWFLGRIFPFRKENNLATGSTISPVELTMLAVFAALPLEIVFASLGGRNFGHYFISLIPAVTTAVAYACFKAITLLRRPRFGVINPQFWVAAGGIVLAGLSLIWMALALLKETPTRAQIASLPTVFSSQYPLGKLEQYIIDMTGPDDPVLIWHVHVGINFITDRRPPQTVLFPGNLFTSENTSRSGFLQFLKEFINNPPKLIVVQEVSSIGLPFVNVPVDKMCTKKLCLPELLLALQDPDIHTELDELRQYFLDHYTLDTHIDDWLIYGRQP